MDKESKIIRTWKGWTTIENAPVYEDLLIKEVFRVVKMKGADGLEKVSISTQKKENEVEFFLVLQITSMEDVITFAGANYKNAYFPDNAQRVLKRYDKSAEHYELKEELILG